MSLKEMNKVYKIGDLPKNKCYIISVNDIQYWTENKPLWKETITNLYLKNHYRKDIKAYVLRKYVYYPAQIKTKFIVSVNL